MGSGSTVALLGFVLLQFGTFLTLTDDLGRAVFSAGGMLVPFGLLFGIAGVRLALDEELPAYESDPRNGRP